MLLAVGLYLYDSAILMFSNEALLIPKANDHWFVGFGSNGTTFKGKGVYIPNPFLPVQPLFKLTWNIEGEAKGFVHPWTANRAGYGRLVPLVWSLAALTFILLPVVLFKRLGDTLILLSFCLIYANVLSIMLALWLNRERFELTHRGLVAMSLDLLVCPPFALNIIRRLSLKVNITEDFIHAAQRLQTSIDWETTRGEVLTRLDDEIACEIDGSKSQAAMVLRRIQILNESQNDQH